MTWKNYAAIGVLVAGMGIATLWDHPAAWILASLNTLAGAGIIVFALNLRGQRDGRPMSNFAAWWGGALMLLANFLLVWFGIIVLMFGVALVGAILLDAYQRGWLAIALAILAAFPAFFLALWLHRRGVGLDWASRSRTERWILVAALAGFLAVTLKAGWNITTDPPGVTRPCAFCSPYVQPPREPQK